VRDHEEGAWGKSGGNVGEILAGFGNVGSIDGVLYVGAGTVEDLAPFFVPEEECLPLAGVVDVRNEERSADVAAEDVVVDGGTRCDRGGELVEVAVRVVGGAAIEFEEFAVDDLGAAFERKTHGGARGDAVVGRVVGTH